MSHFTLRVLDKNGRPGRDIREMIDYGWSRGCDSKRTHSDSWVEFHNHENEFMSSGIHGAKMGRHCLEDRITYSFRI